MSKLLLPPRQLASDLAELATRPKSQGGPMSANALGNIVGSHWPRRFQQCSGSYSTEVVDFQLTIAELGYIIIKPTAEKLAELADVLGYTTIQKK